MKSNAVKKNPYRELGFEKVTAPTKPKGSPKGEKITGKGDLRAGKK